MAGGGAEKDPGSAEAGGSWEGSESNDQNIPGWLLTLVNNGIGSAP